MKTYVITVSRYFPQRHPRKGERTNFIEKIMSGEKIHTIRGNLELWQKRIAEVQAGKAVLSLRYWSGKPYNTPQVGFKVLTSEDGVGVQEVRFYEGNPVLPIIDGIECRCEPEKDGLSLDDYRNWFLKGGYDLSKPMAIIHFTSFRY